MVVGFQVAEIHCTEAHLHVKTLFRMFTEKIDNCMDSHVHWLATGEHAGRLLLGGLGCAEDVAQLKISPHHYRGEWLTGFGWDQNRWPNKSFPTKEILDRIFPDVPVAFSRADGHATWVNSQALRKVGLLNARSLPHIVGGKIIVDEAGQPTGVLIDNAKNIIDAAIPSLQTNEVCAFLLKGAQIFNQAGITHIRDLSCSPEQWMESVQLDQSGLLTLAVEQFFPALEVNHFDQALQLAVQARREATANLRAQGIKIYLDGALGSEGALLSQPYCSGSGRGLSLMTDEELEGVLRITWELKFDLALHTIGDEAVDRAARVACRLWDEGLKGCLHLEHAEMIRPESLGLLKGRNVVFHMQPCHWLSDRHFVEDKLGDLKKYLFPWQALEKGGFRFDFGSDSPIEPPSVADNLQALEDSAARFVPKLQGDPLQYHQHLDKTWTPNTYTVFKNGVAEQVVFRSRNLF